MRSQSRSLLLFLLSCLFFFSLQHILPFIRYWLSFFFVMMCCGGFSFHSVTTGSEIVAFGLEKSKRDIHETSRLHLIRTKNSAQGRNEFRCVFIFSVKNHIKLDVLRCSSSGRKRSVFRLKTYNLLQCEEFLCVARNTFVQLENHACWKPSTSLT